MYFPDINTGNHMISSHIRSTIFKYYDDTNQQKLGSYILKTVNCVKVMLKKIFLFHRNLNRCRYFGF